MGHLTAAILDLPDVPANFTVVEGRLGTRLKHNKAPIWIVEYPAFPDLSQPQFWQVYYSPYVARDEREPWREMNYRLNETTYGYRDPAIAVADAIANANCWPDVKKVRRG